MNVSHIVIGMLLGLQSTMAGAACAWRDEVPRWSLPIPASVQQAPIMFAWQGESQVSIFFCPLLEVAGRTFAVEWAQLAFPNASRQDQKWFVAGFGQVGDDERGLCPDGLCQVEMRAMGEEQWEFLLRKKSTERAVVNQLHRPFLPHVTPKLRELW